MFPPAPTRFPAPERVPGAMATEAPRKRRGLLGGLGLGKKKRRGAGDVKGWLGVDDDFDARKAGSGHRLVGQLRVRGRGRRRRFGWKGGWAGDDPIGDPEFAANEAARIRRRVTETVDRELSEKEVWFVATGAEEVGTVGMQALLATTATTSATRSSSTSTTCGAGQLSWVDAPRAWRAATAPTQRVDRAGQARVSRDARSLIKPRVYKGLSTDATPALARGFKAMSIMAFDSDGLPVNWHWKTDTADNLEPELIERAAEFVTEMVREA